MTQIGNEFTRFSAFSTPLITEAAFAISVDGCCRGDDQ
jgi:hypothetical protein